MRHPELRYSFIDEKFFRILFQKCDRRDIDTFDRLIGWQGESRVPRYREVVLPHRENSLPSPRVTSAESSSWRDSILGSVTAKLLISWSSQILKPRPVWKTDSWEKDYNNLPSKTERLIWQENIVSSTADRMATYDSYPYSHRMASMAYPPAPSAPSAPSPVTPGSKGMPYSVNGISLTSSSMDLLHPSMGYQSSKLLYFSHSTVYLILKDYNSLRKFYSLKFYDII